MVVVDDDAVAELSGSDAGTADGFKGVARDAKCGWESNKKRESGGNRKIGVSYGIETASSSLFECTKSGYVTDM